VEFQTSLTFSAFTYSVYDACSIRNSRSTISLTSDDGDSFAFTSILSSLFEQLKSAPITMNGSINFNSLISVVLVPWKCNCFFLFTGIT
jgi:hypothetical protein